MCSTSPLFDEVTLRRILLLFVDALIRDVLVPVFLRVSPSDSVIRQRRGSYDHFAVDTDVQVTKNGVDGGVGVSTGHHKPGYVIVEQKLLGGLVKKRSFYVNP